MSVSEKLTGLMDSVRGVTGDAQKLSISDATNNLGQVTSNFMHWSVIDLSGDDYDPDKWYLVNSSQGSIDQLQRIIVQKEIYGKDATKTAPWSTRGDKKFTYWLEVLATTNGYGSLPTYVYLLANEGRFTDKTPIAFDVLTTDSKYALWLRGGTDYRVGISMARNTWSVNKGTFTEASGIKVDPKTEAPVTDMSLAKQNKDTLNFVDFKKLGWGN